MGDIILDEVSSRLHRAVFEHGGEFLDLAITFVEAGAQPVPNDLFLFGHRTFDDDLARVHVDDDVVRVEQGLRPRDAKRRAPREFLLPLVLTTSMGA